MTTVTPLGAVDAATTEQILDAWPASSAGFRDVVAFVAYGALLRRLDFGAVSVTVDQVAVMLAEPELRSAWVELLDAGGLVERGGAVESLLRRVRP